MEYSINMKEIDAIATKKGEELLLLEKRNKRRKAKGLPPLPDPQAKADQEVLRRRHKTNYGVTVNGDEALALYLKRKAEMDADDQEEEDNPSDLAVDPMPESTKSSAKGNPGVSVKSDNSDGEDARKKAESIRKVEDMKNGRINHTGIWNDGENRTEGGDATDISMSSSPGNYIQPNPDQSNPADQNANIEQNDPNYPNDPKASAGAATGGSPRRKKSKSADKSDLEEFKNDLYGRLRVSFDELEKSLSDIQGRVSEILTSSESSIRDSGSSGEGDADVKSMFDKYLESRTPVVFNVSGTRMAFDAVKVFYNSPCITILTKAGSANIMPEPGARLLLSYEVNGKRYENDPVTFVGLRVDIEEFGMSFVGFVRDRETDLVSVEDRQMGMS